MTLSVIRPYFEGSINTCNNIQLMVLFLQDEGNAHKPT